MTLIAHAPTGMVEGIARLGIFDKVFSYADLPASHVDQIVDLTSYPYSYEHASSRHYLSIVRRDLDQPWVIYAQTANDQTAVLCPALTPDTGWFALNPQASAMLCELPIINLALGRKIDDLSLFQNERAQGPISVTGYASPNSKKVSQSDVLLLIGGAHPSKRYPLNRWLDLAAKLERRGLKVDALGGPDEGELVQQLNASGVNCSLSRELDQTIDVIMASRISISNDCGTMHVALMLGRPTVGIFGPTIAGSWFARTTPLQESLQSADAVARSSDLLTQDHWTSWPTASEVLQSATDLLAAATPSLTGLDPRFSNHLSSMYTE